MTDLVELNELQLRRQEWVGIPPAKAYSLISNVSAMPAWSPEVVAVRFDEGHGPTVGSWFTGRNVDDDHVWEVRMRVIEADPATRFAWVTVAGGADVTRWGYTFRPENGGTVIEESWQVLRVLPLMGTTREKLLDLRARTTANMEATLAALADSVSTATADE